MTVLGPEAETKSFALAAKVFGVYAIIVPFAVLLSRYSPRRGHYPQWAEIIIWHFCLCGAIAIFAKIAAEMIDLINRKSSASIRFRKFLRWFAIWPALGCAAMAILKIIGAA